MDNTFNVKTLNMSTYIIEKKTVKKEYEKDGDLIEKNGKENKKEGIINKDNINKNNQTFNDIENPYIFKRENWFTQIKYYLSDMNTILHLNNINVKEKETNITERNKSNDNEIKNNIRRKKEDKNNSYNIEI